jgi:hypothetical protein
VTPEADPYRDAVERADAARGARIGRVWCNTCNRAAADVFDSAAGALFAADVPVPSDDTAADVVRGYVQRLRDATGERPWYPHYSIRVLIEWPDQLPDVGATVHTSCAAGHRGTVAINELERAVDAYRNTARFPKIVSGL